LAGRVTGDVMLSKPDGLVGLIFRLGANIEAPQTIYSRSAISQRTNARCRRVGAAEFLRDTEDTSCLMPAERRAVAIGRQVTMAELLYGARCLSARRLFHR
jgi:hypothetical protein